MGECDLLVVVKINIFGYMHNSVTLHAFLLRSNERESSAECREI